METSPRGKMLEDNMTNIFTNQIYLIISLYLPLRLSYLKLLILMF